MATKTTKTTSTKTPASSKLGKVATLPGGSTIEVKTDQEPSLPAVLTATRSILDMQSSKPARKLTTEKVGTTQAKPVAEKQAKPAKAAKQPKAEKEPKASKPAVARGRALPPMHNGVKVPDFATATIPELQSFLKTVTGYESGKTHIVDIRWDVREAVLHGCMPRCSEGAKQAQAARAAAKTDPVAQLATAWNRYLALAQAGIASERTSDVLSVLSANSKALSALVKSAK
jgi:hypothetical protein